MAGTSRLPHGNLFATQHHHQEGKRTTMKITGTWSIEVNRISGKFAAKDDIAEAVRAELETALESADVSGHDVDGDGEYEVIESEVTVDA